MDKRKLAPVIGAACSLLIILLGVIVFFSACGLSESIGFGSTYVSSYSFGADFYTEMYNVTYKAVDQLQYIADGLETGLSRVLVSLRALAKGVGVLIISLGIFSLTRFIPDVLELIPCKTRKAEAAAAQIAEMPVAAEKNGFETMVEAAAETENAETEESAPEVETI